MSATATPAADEGPVGEIRERLRRTIDKICEDAAVVEFRACALSGFAQPVPECHLGATGASESKPSARESARKNG
jgi:hypothetical protein